MSGRTFQQALQLLNDRVNLERLQSFRPQAMEGRLVTLRRLLDAFGQPETSYRTVHITGTKGKGSTCIMLESLLSQDGCRIGRFTSPHIACFTERLAINGEPCPEYDFTDLFFFVTDQIAPETLASLTYFELLTLLAFVYFSQQKVDAALFEVGLGGRLDATNLCKPDISIITSISLDHRLQLGTTLESIASEKSGIIKPNVPVITTVQNPKPLDVIRKKAEELTAPLYVLGEHFSAEPNDIPHNAFRYATLPGKFPHTLDLDRLTLTLPGKHQIRNASAALSAYLLLQKSVQSDKIRTGLQQAFLPLRGEVIRLSENLPAIVFDGAHNRASMNAFVSMVCEMFPNRRRVLIFGSSQGKDIAGMVAEIEEHFDQIILTQSTNSRSSSVQELLAFFPIQERLSIIEDASAALSECLHSENCSSIICVSGSLYLAAELRCTLHCFGKEPRA